MKLRTDMSTDDVEELIRRWIFSERDRRVCRRRIVDGVRFEQLAEEFNLSVSQVKRIVSKGLQAIISRCW